MKTMKSAKTALQLAVFLAAGSLAIAGDATRKPQDYAAETTYEAIDARGQVIGDVLRVDFSLQQMLVAIDVKDALALVLVRHDSFSHAANPLVYFRSQDCTGRAFLGSSASRATFGHPSAVAGPAGTLYLGELGSDYEEDLGSFLTDDGCVAFQATFTVMDAVPYMDLADLFTAPYGIVRK